MRRRSAASREVRVLLGAQGHCLAKSAESLQAPATKHIAGQLPTYVIFTGTWLMCPVPYVNTVSAPFWPFLSAA